VQRYDIGIAVHEYFTRNFSFSCITLHLAVAVLTSSTTAGARHSSSKLGSALAVAVVAVLQFSEKYSHAPKICSIFIYIYIYKYRVIFPTFVGFILELQHCNAATASAECFVLPVMPSASSLDNVNKCNNV